MSKPDITEDDVNLVVRALRSGRLSIGPFVDQFEERAREYLGTRHAVAVTNGTSGLHLCRREGRHRGNHFAIQLCGIRKLHFI